MYGTIFVTHTLIFQLSHFPQKNDKSRTTIIFTVNIGTFIDVQCVFFIFIDNASVYFRIIPTETKARRTRREILYKHLINTHTFNPKILKSTPKERDNLKFSECNNTQIVFQVRATNEQLNNMPTCNNNALKHWLFKCIQNPSSYWETRHLLLPPLSLSLGQRGYICYCVSLSCTESASSAALYKTPAAFIKCISLAFNRLFVLRMHLNKTSDAWDS